MTEARRAHRIDASEIAEAQARADYDWLAAAIESHFRRDFAHIGLCNKCKTPTSGKGRHMQQRREKRCAEGQQLHDEWLGLAADAELSLSPDRQTMRLTWADGSRHDISLRRTAKPH